MSSSDGGGVRGLSSIMILNALMRKVRDLHNSRCKDASQALTGPALPCHYFDLVGGTSTGGQVFQGVFYEHLH
jgi:patatin-like phospholipase/acyl hydrolase